MTYARKDLLKDKAVTVLTILIAISTRSSWSVPSRIEFTSGFVIHAAGYDALYKHCLAVYQGPM